MSRLFLIIALASACSCTGAGSSIESVDSADGGAASMQGCTVGSQACAPTFYCEATLPNACAADANGSCVPVPRFCPEIYKPECGCDGRTYGNNCDRRAARAQLAHNGRCAAPGASE